jgi:Lon protease-like protein
VSQRLPLFPLAVVLLPGLFLPLQIFEDRYRRMIRDLLDVPVGPSRAFGVVAIRHGREVGAALPTFYEVGCTAELRRVEPHADGRFSLVAEGGRRFRVTSVDCQSHPYLVGEVDYLDDTLGDAHHAATLASVVSSQLLSYVDRLSAANAMQIDLPDLPEDPRHMSYLVAAALPTEMTERQSLLAAPDAVARLRAERSLLNRELKLLERMTAIPTNELTKISPCPN